MAVPVYRALIVCNWQHGSGTGLADLHGPHADGILLTSALLHKGSGYFHDSDVETLSNLPVAAMSRAVNKFFHEAGPDDVSLFYFSGHGIYDDQQLYLCASDTDTSLLPVTSLANSIMSAILRASQAKAKIVILDCCHSGAFRLKGDVFADSELPGMGTYILAASGSYRAADDAARSGRPSPFTQAVVDGLLHAAPARGSGDLLIADLFAHVKTALNGHPRPWLQMNATGDIPIARREKTEQVIAAAAATTPPEPSVETSFLDAATTATRPEPRRVAAFRAELRDDVLAEMPQQISDGEFLARAHLMVGDRLTRAGALLFGEYPTKVVSSAIVQCTNFHGRHRDGPIVPLQLRGTIPEQIVRARDFVADLARRGEEPDEEHATAQPAYDYPMIAVREIIANALAHRDYERDESSVHVRVYADRVEVINPGIWAHSGLASGDTVPLRELQGESRRPNFRLADALTWIRLVEGVGAGIPRALSDCRRVGAPEPTVTYQQGLVIVTIYPRSLAADPDDAHSSSGQLKADDLLSRVAEATRVMYRDATVSPRPEAGYLRVANPVPSGIGVELWPVGVIEGDPTLAAIDGFVSAVHAGFASTDPFVRSQLVYSGSPADPQVLRRAREQGVWLRSFVDYQGLVDLRPLMARQADRLAQDRFYPPGLYVPQRFRRLDGSDHEVHEDVAGQIIEWLSGSSARMIIVLGDFGHGKTSLMRHVARTLPEKVPGLQPVLVELRALEKALSLDELLAQHLVRHGVDDINMDKLRYMVRSGRIVLLFDGFDELAVRVGFSNAADHLGVLLAAVQEQAKIVLTSRTQHFQSTQQVLTALGHQVTSRTASRIVELQRFSPEQIIQFLTNLYGDTDFAGARYRLMGEIEDLLGLATNPRMLSFIAALDGQLLREIWQMRGRISAANLYANLVHRWLAGEADRQRHLGGPPSLDEGERLAACRVLAESLWTSAMPAIDVHELPEAVAATLTGFADLGLSVNQVAHTIASGSLLVRTDEGAFGFVHQSVMEWIVADTAATALRESHEAASLSARRLSPLMVDFLIDLAGAEVARAWATRTLRAVDAPQAAKHNALAINERLGLATDSGGPAQVLAGVDLRGQDLTGRDLRRADLRNAVLADMRLHDVDLAEANLEGADFSRVRMDGGSIARAALTGSAWTGAALLGVELGDAADHPALSVCAITGRDPVSRHLAVTGNPVCLAFSPSGHHCALGRGPVVEIVDTSDWRTVRTLIGHTSPVLAVAFHPDGTRLATASDDGTARIWDTATGHTGTVLTGHIGSVTAVAFHPDGATLATASNDGTARIWDTTTGQPLTTLTGHANWVRAVAFHPGGTMLATASFDETVRVWDTATGQIGTVLTGHTGSLTAVAFHPDGATLATASNDGTARIWDTTTGQQLIALTRHAGPVFAVAYRPDRKQLATASNDGTARIWDTTTGQQLTALGGHTNRARAAAYHPDGTMLATASDDRTARIWDTTTGQTRTVLNGHTGPVTAAAYHPDGTMLATTSKDGTARIWQTATGQPLTTLTGHTNWVRAVAYRPDGTQLATASDDRTARIWDTTIGQTRATLTGHTGPVVAVAFHPDGTRLATASDDRTVRVWDTTTGQIRATLSGRTGQVSALAFHPDGGQLAATYDDGAIRLWRWGGGGVVVLVPFGEDGYAVLLSDGRYKLHGDPGETLWWAMKLCRFGPGELDGRVPGLDRLPLDHPIW